VATIGIFVAAMAGSEARIAIAATAERDLSGFSGPGGLFTVTISLNVPGGTTAAGVEDQPPAGWVVSNISDGGDYDELTGEVKWGPFFDPSIPGAVTYDVTPPFEALGHACFVGTVTVDVSTEPVQGDQCVSSIPTSSGWCAFILVLVLGVSGTIALWRSGATWARLSTR